MTTRVRIELAQQCGEKKVQIVRVRSIDADTAEAVVAVLDAATPAFEDVVYDGMHFAVREVEG